MKNFLFAALLGCFITSGLAQRDTFHFTDHQGRCWICAPGVQCQPCSSNMPLLVPPATHPDTCPSPDCSILSNRQFLFPMNDPRFFYQCVNTGGNWAPATLQCQCEAYFDYNNQRCEALWMWSPFCRNLIIPLPIPDSCSGVQPTTPAPLTTAPLTTAPPPETTAATTQAPTTNNPCQCIPWMPCMCMPMNPCMSPWMPGCMPGMMG